MFLIFRADNQSLCYANFAARQMFPAIISHSFQLSSLHPLLETAEFASELSRLLTGKTGIIEKQLIIKASSGLLPIRLTVQPGEFADLDVIEVRGYSAADVAGNPDERSREDDHEKLLAAENRLDVSEKTMTTIVELAVDGIVIIDENGIIKGFNRSAEKMFGYSASEALGKNVALLMPEPHKSGHDGYIKRYLSTGIPHIVGIGREVDACRRDGSLFPIDLAVGEVKLPGGSLFTGFIRDLSESRKLKSEHNSFFQMSLDLFCIIGVDGVFKRTNSQWHDVMGYGPGEVEGENLINFIHSEDLGSDASQFIAQTIAARNVLGRVLRLRQKNGEYRWILWNSTVDKANAAIYGVGRDITEQKRILEELQTAKLDAERSSEAKTFFIAKMSHELRTPLNSIIGFSRHLQKNPDKNLSDKETLYLERISRNGNSLLKLINSLLDFSKAEAGLFERDNQETNLIELLGEVLDLMQILIEEKKVDIKLVLPAVCQTIKSDPVKLRQIIQNLVDNAIKFSDGKAIVVQLFADEQGLPRNIDVIDSGPGIASDQLELIFEAFQQGDNSVARKYGGAGLGLSIARSFASLLGLEIVVKSELGRGSCFSIVFPGINEDNL